MGHEEANRIEAAERYLLGELSDAERDQFEEHFFGCQACAEDVRTGAIFEANARAVLAEQPRQASAKPGWWEWVGLRPVFAGAMACLLVLVGGVGYEAVVAHGLRRELAEFRLPQPYPSVFLRSATRGDEQRIEVPRESRFLGISLDLPPGQSFGHYVGEVLSESGVVLFSVPLASPRTPGDPLNLLIPASSLESGRRYTLILRGLEVGPTAQPGIEIAKYPFVTQRN